MKLVYPAIFTAFDDGAGYTVEFPDLPGCVTEGNNLSDAIFMATDAASGWVLTELEEGKMPPKATDIENVDSPDGSFVSLVALDMDSYASQYGKKAVKKTLTIPAWMETYVEKNKISCSEVLQDALNKMISA